MYTQIKAIKLLKNEDIEFIFLDMFSIQLIMIIKIVMKQRNCRQIMNEKVVFYLIIKT